MDERKSGINFESDGDGFLRANTNLDINNSSIGKRSSFTSRFKVTSSQNDQIKSSADEKCFENVQTCYKSKKNLISTKLAVYYFLTIPRTVFAYLYQLTKLIIFLVVICITAVCPVEEIFQNRVLYILYLLLNLICLLAITVETALRIWSCSARWLYRGRNQIKILYEYTVLIDTFLSLYLMLVIVLYTAGSAKNSNIVKALGVLRFFKVSILLHYERLNHTILIFGKISWIHSREILAGYLMMAYLILSFSFLVYLAESPYKEAKIKSLPDSLYFTIISYTTIGYGDFHPVTRIGKICVSILAIISVSFVALPSGIIGSAIAIQLSGEVKKKKRLKHRPYAIRLIQSAWRLHSLKDKGTNSAVYKKLRIIYTTSIAVNQNNDNDNDSHHMFPSTPRTKGFKIVDVNMQGGSTTVTLRNKANLIKFQNIVLPFLNVKEKGSFLHLFLFVAKLQFGAILRAFDRVKDSSTMSGDILENLQRQNNNLLNQLDVINNKINEVFSKTSHDSRNKHKFIKHHTSKKKSGLIDVSSNFDAINRRLDRIENLLNRSINHDDIFD